VPVHVVDHPLVKHKLALVREHDITTKDFRDLASELANLLTYEATQHLSVFWLIGLPFSAAGGNVDAATEKLIKEPAKYTFDRPLGEF